MKQDDLDIINKKTPDGMTHLMRMAKGVKSSSVILLDYWLELESSYGSDSGVDIKNNDGDTALHLVFQEINTCSREVALIKTSLAIILIHAHADPLMPNNAGVRPIDMITVELAQELGLPHLSKNTPFFKGPDLSIT